MKTTEELMKNVARALAAHPASRGLYPVGVSVCCAMHGRDSDEPAEGDGPRFVASLYIGSGDYQMVMSPESNEIARGTGDDIQSAVKNAVDAFLAERSKRVAEYDGVTSMLTGAL